MKVWIKTFGCRANQYDSEAVRALALGAGHEVVDRATDADVAIFNSCAVTADAEADLRQSVRRAHRDNPTLRATIMGCASGLDDRRDALRALPGVEHVIAGADLDEVAMALGAAVPLALRTSSQSGARALLRVQDGCDEHCTFCATTMARGANRSRAIDEIVDEAWALASRHAEIVITGIHIGAYGADIGSSLGALMEALVSSVPRVRFRLTSIEATELDETLAGLMIERPDRVAPHLHAPLQSGSDRVLKRMGRHWYTSRGYAERVERLAERVTVLGLGADVITGFPGETEDDHRATVALVRSLPFTYLHVFPFSLRPGTAAERLPNPVAPSAARDRAAELREIATEKAAAHVASRLGGVVDAVVVGSGQRREVLTEDYLTALPGDPLMPRGSRFSATLASRGDDLVATPI